MISVPSGGRIYYQKIYNNSLNNVLLDLTASPLLLRKLSENEITNQKYVYSQNT